MSNYDNVENEMVRENLRRIAQRLCAASFDQVVTDQFLDVTSPATPESAAKAIRAALETR